MTRPRLTAAGDVEPTVWDALIGGALGLLLIYAAGYIPYRILHWLKGPDEDRFWAREYVDGELSGLDYDS